MDKTPSDPDGCVRCLHGPGRRSGKTLWFALLGLAGAFLIFFVITAAKSVTSGDVPADLGEALSSVWAQASGAGLSYDLIPFDAMLGVVALFVPAAFGIADKLKSPGLANDELLSRTEVKPVLGSESRAWRMMDAVSLLLMLLFGAMMLYALASMCDPDASSWETIVAGMVAASALAAVSYLDPVTPLGNVTQANLKALNKQFNNRQTIILSALPKAPSRVGFSEWFSALKRTRRCWFAGIFAWTLLLIPALMLLGAPLTFAAALWVPFAAASMAAVLLALSLGGRGDRRGARAFGAAYMGVALLLLLLADLASAQFGSPKSSMTVGVLLSLALALIAFQIVRWAMQASDGKGPLRDPAAAFALDFARKGRKAIASDDAEGREPSEGPSAAEQKRVLRLCEDAGGARRKFPPHCGVVIAKKTRGASLPRQVYVEYWDELSPERQSRTVTWEPKDVSAQVIPLLFTVGTKVRLVLPESAEEWAAATLTVSPTEKEVVVREGCRTQVVLLDVELDEKPDQGNDKA